MPVFACENCGCVENTAVSGGYRQRMRGAQMRCAKCDPARGRWHGQFPRKHTREYALHVGPDRMLYSPDDERAPRPLTPFADDVTVRLVAFWPGLIAATFESADHAAFTAFRAEHEARGCMVECVSEAELERARARHAAQVQGADAGTGRPRPS